MNTRETGIPARVRAPEVLQDGWFRHRSSVRRGGSSSTRTMRYPHNEQCARSMRADRLTQGFHGRVRAASKPVSFLQFLAEEFGLSPYRAHHAGEDPCPIGLSMTPDVRCSNSLLRPACRPSRAKNEYRFVQRLPRSAQRLKLSCAAFDNSECIHRPCAVLTIRAQRAPEVSTRAFDLIRPTNPGHTTRRSDRRQRSAAQ